MKFNEKAQQVIEYLLIVVAVVGAVMGAAVPFKNATERSLNRAIATIYESYTWRLGDPGNCTSADGTILTCGSGTANRDVWCQRDDDRTKVADAYCEAQAGARPSEKISCDMGPCGMTYHWVGLGYGTCSRDCGGGTQSQTVECRNSSGVKEDDESKCASAGPKPDERACNETPCYGWVAGGSCIGLCSASCGIGRCQQRVVCFNNLTSLQELDESKCTGLKPPTEISCNTAASCGYQWIASGWGACETATAGCGPGKKYQTVRCVRASDKSEVDPSNCAGARKPHASADCHLGGCYNWYLTGGWGPCSRICNTYDLIGTQNAIVECRDRKENKVDDAKCADVVPKPGMIRDCRDLPICEFSWGNGEWDVCSNNCLVEGIQTRDVWCTNVTEGKNYDLKYCLHYKPPERPATQACIGECYKWVVAIDWDDCKDGKTCGIRTQRRTIECRKNDGAGAKVDDSNCFSSRGTGFAGPRPADSQNCEDTSGCCGNGNCEHIKEVSATSTYSEICDTCAKDCLTSCWWGKSCCMDDGKCNTGENCTNSIEDCSYCSAWVDDACGAYGTPPCPEGQIRQTRSGCRCSGAIMSRCKDSVSCSYSCGGTLSTNAAACSKTETTDLTGPGSWSYSGCGGLGKCRAYCNSGYHAVSGGCEKDAPPPSSIKGCGCSCPLGSYCEYWAGQTNCSCYIPAGYWGRTDYGADIYSFWSNTSGNICRMYPCDFSCWTKGPGCWFWVDGFGSMDLCWELTTITPPADDICNY